MKEPVLVGPHMLHKYLSPMMVLRSMMQFPTDTVLSGY